MVIARASRQDDAGIVFKTHANYLRAFATLAAGSIHNRADEIYDRCATRIERSGCLPTKQLAAGLEQVQTSLQHAWGTELLMSLSTRISNEDELVRLANTWLAVQAYYCIYHGTQAVVVAGGHQRPISHPKTQQHFCNVWGSRDISVEPWTLLATANGLRNLPGGVEIDRDVKPLRLFEPTAAWSLACKALETTRKKLVDEALKTARVEKRHDEKRRWETEETARIRAGRRPRKTPRRTLPILTPQEQNTRKDAVRPTSLLDYLYRLRLRTNYVDAAMFVEGPSEPAESIEVRKCLRILAGTTLLLCEMAVMRRVGKATFIKWMLDWKNTNVPSTVTGGLVARVETLTASVCP